MVRRRFTLTFVIISIQSLALLLLNLRQFRFRIEFFCPQPLGTLQRRESVIGPDSLKVGLAVGHTRRSPRSVHCSCVFFVRHCLRGLAGDGYNREHQRSQQSENLISHSKTSFKPFPPKSTLTRCKVSENRDVRISLC